MYVRSCDVAVTADELLRRATMVQTVHTAAVFSAKFGKLSALRHLIVKHRANVHEVLPCGLCVLCDRVHKTEVKAPVFERLGGTTHDQALRVSMAHGAAAGGQIEVLKYLAALSGSLDAPDIRNTAVGRNCAFAIRRPSDSCYCLLRVMCRR